MDSDVKNLSNRECLNAGPEGLRELDRRVMEKQKEFQHLSTFSLFVLLITRDIELSPTQTKDRAIRDLLLSKLDP